jgi:hypothetical protein
MPDESILYDGCIVAERSTGIIWRAQRNVSGVFEKRYIKYPWRLDCYQPTTTFNNGTPGGWGAWGWNTIGGYSINASASDIVDSRIVIPVTGIYTGSDWLKWEPGAGGSGGRALSLMVNDQFPGGVHDVEWYEIIAVPNNVVNEVCTNEVNFCRKFNKGDRLVGMVWQNSGSNNAPTIHSMQMQLLRALDV